MATNPYVNKVVYGNTTVMDISDSDVQESDVATGKVFYKGTGQRSVGTGTGGVTIEYVGEFTANSGGSSATTVNLASGTYARPDYADLTIDNFIVMPSRGTSNLTSETPNRFRTNNTVYHAAQGILGYKKHEYTAATGTFKFYGGVTINAGTSTSSSGTLSTQTTVNMSPKWKVYVVKPGISSFE